MSNGNCSRKLAASIIWGLIISAALTQIRLSRLGSGPERGKLTAGSMPGYASAISRHAESPRAGVLGEARLSVERTPVGWR